MGRIVNIGKETEQVEFKKSTGEIKDGVISIASILNKHESGDLYFGVRNNGDVIGQEITDSTLRSVSQAVRTGIKPPVYPVIEEQEYEGRHVVHVGFEGKQRPYTAHNIPRIRIADEDTVMDQETYRRMMNERENKSDSWESRPSKYHISDIDQKVLADYLRKAKEAGRASFPSSSPKAVMTRLELAEGDVLLNAGAALFVDSGMNELQIARFASDRRLTFLDIQRYTGSILSLADIAVKYVIDKMDWRVEFDGSLERKEIPEIPVSAVREAMINAFAHRDIGSMQAVDLSVYKSYIEIYSPGTFPDKFKPEQFIEEALKPIRRNPLITRTLYYSKDMETFATGLKRIHDECAEAGVKVEFRDDTDGFTVRFYRHCGSEWAWAENTLVKELDKKRPDEKWPENEGPDAECPKKCPKNEGPDAEWPEKCPKNNGPDGKCPESSVHEKKTPGKSISMSSRRESVLEMIKDNPSVSRASMAGELNLTERQIRWVLDCMKSEGIIHYEGSLKGGHWVINRNYLTDED